jgi:hypothetical protein
MTAYYSVNPSTQTVVDVLYTTSLTVPTTGMLPVRVDPGVGIHGNPTTLDDLLTAKADGLLAKYPGHYAVVLDPCLSVVQTPTVPGVDTGNSFRFYPGNGFNNHVLLDGAQLVTLDFILPYSPASATFIWELYTISVSETAGVYSRSLTLVPTDSASIAVDITFGGVSQAATSGVSALVSNPNQNFSATFTSTDTVSYYLGGWALLLGPETEIIS